MGGRVGDGGQVGENCSFVAEDGDGGAVCGDFHGVEVRLLSSWGVETTS